MVGLKILIALPEDQQDLISTEFGDICQLYKKVFELNYEDYQLFIANPVTNQPRLQKIHSELFAIQYQLNRMGLEDHEIVSEISKDFREMVVKKRVRNIDSLFDKLGDGFGDLRTWLRDTYNI